MEILISLCVGIALSASSGFRVFVPMLVANLASKYELLHLSQGFEWLESPIATLIFGVATVVEIGAYYIPFIDNLLATLAVPSSFVAGTILTTSILQIDSPILQWSLGILAGGGVAGTIQSGTGLLRLASSKLTGGIGNPIFSTIENFSSITISVLTLWIPIIVAIFVLILSIYLFRKIFKRFFSKTQN
ncbi:MAG: DUF4126 domain-containing protein [Spirosomataceae bacterium]